MLLSGFTFIRNAVKYDFPIVECIESMLPIVDELVVNIGKSDDETEALIRSIKNDKIKIVHSVWDDAKTKDGLVLSEQTNIALDACSGRWCLYLQADEAIHESEHAKIRRAVEDEERKSAPADGFSFKYLHFYGGYNLVQRAWNWYPNEIRIVRRDSGARSFGDAQTFRKTGDARLTAVPINAHVFHYGHAREPEQMKKKIQYFHRFWHGDKHGIAVDAAYQHDLKELTWYWDTHPACYAKRVEQGKTWSETPESLLAKVFASPARLERIVFFAREDQKSFAHQLKSLVDEKFYGKKDAPKTVVLTRLYQWLGFMLKNAFSRDRSALVDLWAEERSSWTFICWIWDALAAFRWRVAHSPTGALSKFRRKFYTAVDWGCHEIVPMRGEHGFVVPRELTLIQLAKWIGITEAKVSGK